MQTRLCITKVNNGTTAKQAGCQEDDFIVQINGIRHVSHFDDVRAAVRSRPEKASDLICYSVEKGSLYSFPVDPSNAGISFKAAPVPADMEAKIMGLFDELDAQAPAQSHESRESPDEGIVVVDEESDLPASQEQTSVPEASVASPASAVQMEEPKLDQQASAESAEEIPPWEKADSAQESVSMESSHDQVDALLNGTDGSSASEAHTERDNTEASTQTAMPEEDGQSNAAAALGADEWPDANVDIDALVMGSGDPNEATEATETTAATEGPEANDPVDEPDQASGEALGADSEALGDGSATQHAAMAMDDSEVIVVGEHDDPDLAREVRGFLDKTKIEGLDQPGQSVEQNVSPPQTHHTIDQMSGPKAGEPELGASDLMDQVASGSAEPSVLASCFSKRKIPIVFGPTFNGMGFSRMSYLGVVQVMVHGVASEKLISSAYTQLEAAALEHDAGGVVDCRQNIESMGMNAQGEPVVLINLYGTAIRCMN